MKFEYKVMGKTVKEAYNKALALYSSMGEIVKHEVICEGKKGFLGIFGARQAEIKVTVDDGREEKKAPQEPKKKEQKNAPAQGNNKNNNERKDAPKPQEQKSTEQKPQEQKSTESAPQKNNKNAKRPQNQQKKNDKKDAPRKEQPQKEPLKDEDIKVTPNEKELAMGFIKSFVESIGFDCKVVGDLTPDEQGYVSRLVSIEGENVSALIGHHGEMLDAIQYLANLCLARRSDSDHKEYVKVIVDIENYRAKREETLRALARKMSEKALRQKKNIHLDPMNPYERRIIHSEVQKIEGVSTHSVGYDETRKIIITVDKK